MKEVQMSQYSCRFCSLLALTILAGCHRQRSPEISGVYGTVQINSSTATPGTLVSFINRENDSDSFTTVVGNDGKYEYRPPANITISPGEFIAVVRPLKSRTVEDENGMPQSVPIPGAPESYGKYSDKKKSDLSIRLTTGKVERFDISIQAPLKQH